MCVVASLPLSRKKKDGEARAITPRPRPVYADRVLTALMQVRRAYFTVCLALRHSGSVIARRHVVYHEKMDQLQEPALLFKKRR